MNQIPSWDNNLQFWRWRNKANVYDYASAEAWIKGGRGNNISRTAYIQGVRLVRQDKQTIDVQVHYWKSGVGAYWLRIVTYRADGVTFIDADGTLLYQGARSLIERFVPGLTVYQRKNRLVLRRPIDGLTPSKIQKCRVCSGRGFTYAQCWQQMRKWHWADIPDSHPDKPCDVAGCKAESQRTFVHPCEHGVYVTHDNLEKTYSCYRCSGSGRREYGNRATGVVWDGSRIGITADWQFVTV